MTPQADWLSVRIRVGGYGCPISVKKFLYFMINCPFINIAAISASIADPITFLIIFARM